MHGLAHVLTLQVPGCRLFYWLPAFNFAVMCAMLAYQVREHCWLPVLAVGAGDVVCLLLLVGTRRGQLSTMSSVFGWDKEGAAVYHANRRT